MKDQTKLGKPEKPEDKKERELKALYEAYTFERQSRGGEVLSYDEWKLMRRRDRGK